MLSFEEFQAVNNRDKIKENVGNGITTKLKEIKRKDKSTVDREKDAVAQSKTWRDWLGETLENPICQSMFVVVLVLDIFCAYLGVAAKDLFQQHNLPYVLYGTKYFGSLASMVYAVELLAVYVAFDLRSLVHLGYVIDLVVISVQVYAEMEGTLMHGKLFNFLRFWRFLRLYNVLVGIEREKRGTLMSEIAKLENKIREVTDENESSKVEVEKQKEARASVEKLLQNYKDEVDTLNEALKIAAMDIAEVAQDDDQMSSDDEDDQEQASLKQLLTRKKNSMRNEIDKSDTLRDILATDDEAAHMPASTILVHESGKFEVR